MSNVETFADRPLGPRDVAFAAALSAAVLFYALLSEASLVQEIVFVGALWLYVLYRWLREHGRPARRAENAALAGAGVLASLYALFTPADLLATVGVLALLWIGARAARIERRLRAGDAEA